MTTGVRLHLTNIQGLGAIQLTKALLPALLSSDVAGIDTMYVPASGEITDLARTLAPRRYVSYPRHLPNAASRLLECTVLAGRFSGRTPLLVLGDVPLRASGPQTVLVHSLHFTSGSEAGSFALKAKYGLYRELFRRNASRAGAFIVQTRQMQESLERTYEQTKGRTFVVRLPAPAWAGAIRDSRRARANAGGLRLFYPASAYRHKNHSILSKLREPAALPLQRVVLTIDPADNPVPGAAWIECKGSLPPSQVVAEYQRADALFFPSHSESMGFPLVEAMTIGLPVVCADRPYARELCGSEALYFDPGSAPSLETALVELHRRLESGWWPDWRRQLADIPADWTSVAAAMLRITLQHA
jgi:hypothetical protein